MQNLRPCSFLYVELLQSFEALEFPLGIVGVEVKLHERWGSVTNTNESQRLSMTGNRLRHDPECTVSQLVDAP